DLALGNAVGSIICDTGLILGLALLLGPIPLNREVVNRQGWIQIGSALLLVALAFPWSAPGTALSMGGHLPQWTGWLFLALLVLYIWKSIQWSLTGQALEVPKVHEEPGSNLAVVLRLVIG